MAVGDNGPAAPATGGGFDFEAAMERYRSAAGGATADNPEVYLGDIAGSTTHANKEMPGGERLPAPTDKVVPLSKAETMIYRDGVQQRFVDLLLRNGIIERGNYSWDDIEGWWLKAVAGAANARRYGGGKDITPYEWIELWHGSGAAGAGGGGTGPSTTTSVEKSFTEVDDLDARAAAEDAYSALLGRAPKGKEASAIHAALQAYAQSHPSIVKRTVTDDGEGNVTAKTRTSGGMSAAAASQLVEDEVKGRPGYGEYQAATTYFNALQQALGATADV
jgi:hypothetical protein